MFKMNSKFLTLVSFNSKKLLKSSFSTSASANKIFHHNNWSHQLKRGNHNFLKNKINYNYPYSNHQSLLFFSTSNLFSNVSKPETVEGEVKVEKAKLSKLRKKTGFTFSKCKEALVKHNNDLKLAEEWLIAQSKEHGWSQANKLEGRKTIQGQISIKLSNDLQQGLLIETNCETDFVARNVKFHNLVEKITKHSFNYLSKQNKQDENKTTNITKFDIETQDELVNILKQISVSNNNLLDEIAISIGELGENIKINRMSLISINNKDTSNKLYLCGFTHPAPVLDPTTIDSNETIMVGKYGAIVALKTKSGGNKPKILQVGRQICQHIIGMNPIEIGDMTASANPEIENKSKEPAQVEKKEVKEQSTEDDEYEYKQVDKDEEDTKCLLDQDFLLDPDLTTREFLIQNSISEILQFTRFDIIGNKNEE